MGKSDSQYPFTSPRFGFPSLGLVPLPGESTGPLLFRVFPRSLDMSPCPRKVPVARTIDHAVQPTDPGEVIGTFDVNDFGVYPHTSIFFLSTLHTHHCCYARKTRLPSPCHWFDGSASCQLGKAHSFQDARPDVASASGSFAKADQRSVCDRARVDARHGLAVRSREMGGRNPRASG